MRTIYLIVLQSFIMLVAVVYNAKGQHPFLSSLDYTKLAVTKNSGKPDAAAVKFYPGGSTASLVAALGKPQNISTQYSEIDNVEMTVYSYEGAKFYFMKGHLTGFHISGPGYYLITDTTTVNGDPYRHYYKVGDAVSRVQNSYPASYKSMEKERLFLGLYEMIAVNSQSAGKPKYEKRLLDDVVMFGHKNGKINGFYF